MKKYWIKLYIDMLDNAKMGRLENHLWRRAVECYLLAGEQGDDGALRPVEEMAWRLRLSEDKLLEDLHCLAEVGVVHEDQGAWMVTNFKERQEAVPVNERVRRYRERNSEVTNRYRSCNEVAEDDSISTSTSDSVSFSDSVKGVRIQGEGGTPQSHDCGVAHPRREQAGTGVGSTPEQSLRGQAPTARREEGGFGTPLEEHSGLPFDKLRASLNHRVDDEPRSEKTPQTPGEADGFDTTEDHRLPFDELRAALNQRGNWDSGTGKLPKTPGEAARHRDIGVFQQATGGRIPGLAQYGVVIDSVRLLRERERLADEALVKYLMPYWLAWRSRKRKDGREYDQGNITWLTEWAVNGSIPGSATEEKNNPADVIREVARRKA